MTISVRIGQESDAALIADTMIRTGSGPGSGISEDLFKETMTPENVVKSLEKMRWLLWEGGLFLVIPVTLTTYEVHIAVLPGNRGAKALAATDAALSLVFTRTPCTLLVGRTPLANRAACVFATAAGFRRIRTSGPSQISSLCFFDWLASRKDPVYALTQCQEWGQSEKSAASQSVLKWITRGDLQEARHGA